MAAIDPDHVYAHAASAGAIGLSFVGYLPGMCAVVGAAWYLLQIWETDTVRGWTGRPVSDMEARELIHKAAVVADDLLATAKAVAAQKVINGAVNNK